jgi:ribosomal protein S18 acetylase RimI-like enzyme
MLITFADNTNAQEILDLQRLAYQMEAERYNDYTLPPLTQTLEDIQDDFVKMTILKADLDDKIVGSVRAYAENGTCYIGRLIVHPNYMGQGIGTTLMYKIENEFQDVQRFELFTGHKTTGALHIYFKMGYQTFKQKEMDTHTLVFLEKYLATNG